MRTPNCPTNPTPQPSAITTRDRGKNALIKQNQNGTVLTRCERVRGSEEEEEEETCLVLLVDDSLRSASPGGRTIPMFVLLFLNSTPLFIFGVFFFRLILIGVFFYDLGFCCEA